MLNVYKALSLFNKRMKPVMTDSKNPHFRNKYASLNAVLDAIEEPLASCGLYASQMVQGDKLLTSIVHLESGEQLVCSYPLHMNPDPQKFASSLTYSRRYSLVTALGLMVEESADDDANKASGIEIKKVNVQKNVMKKGDELL